jgi:hypothetical protein
LHPPRDAGTISSMLLSVTDDALFLTSCPTSTRLQVIGSFSMSGLLAQAQASMQTWVILGLAAMTVIYLTIRPFKKRDPLIDKPFRMSLAQQKSLERDMQSLLVELHEMARRMNAQIETRATRLELLIQEADEKIARLSRFADEKSGGSSTASETPDPISKLNPTTTDRPQDRPAPDGPSTTPIKPDPFRDIYRLADQGLEVRQIATRVAKPSGEVELILALRRPEELGEPPAIASVG